MLTNSVRKDTFYLLLLGRCKLSYKEQWFGLRGTPSTVRVSLIVLKSCLLKAQSDHACVSVDETALFFVAAFERSRRGLARREEHR